MASGYAKIRDGLREHHPKMSYAEIAVFLHLLLSANRSEGRGTVGLCPGMTGNKLAGEMGKSRESVQRALRSLSGRRYIERREDGIFIPNFNGDSPEQHPAVIPPGLESSRLENSPEVAGIQPGAGCDPAQIRLENSPVQPLLIDQETVDVVDEGDEGAPKRRSSSPTSGLIRWDWELETFSGDRERLRKEVHASYLEEFGREWIQDTWSAILDWCKDYPERIVAKKDHWRFVKGWFRRAASESREKQRSNSAISREANVGGR